MMERADAHFIDCGTGTASGTEVSRINHEEAGGGTSGFEGYIMAGVSMLFAQSDVAYIYEPDGTLYTSWGDNSDGGWGGDEGTTWNSCRDIINTPDGGHIILSYVNPKGIAKLTSEGVLDTTWGTDGYAVTGYPVQCGITDSEGNLYVGSVGTSGVIHPSISKFDSTGTLVAGWGAGGDGHSYWDQNYRDFPLVPQNMRLSSDESILYVTSTSGSQMVIGIQGTAITPFKETCLFALSTGDGFLLDGVHNAAWGTYGYGFYEVGVGNEAWELEIDDSDVLTLFLYQNSGAEGNLLKINGLTGIKDGTFPTILLDEAPYKALSPNQGGGSASEAAMKVDANGNIWILYYIQDALQPYDYRVKRFDSAGTLEFTKEWNDATYAAWCMTVDGDSFFVGGVSGWDGLTGNIGKYSWAGVLDESYDIVVGFTPTVIQNPFPDIVTVIGTDEYWQVFNSTGSELLLPSLIGEEVSILADGVVMPNQIVDDNGRIDCSGFPNVKKLHWGLAYESKLRPMKPVSQPDMMSATVTCKEMGISVHNTDDIKYGVHDDDMHEINFDDVQWKNKCEIDGLFTGSVAVSVPDGFSVNLPLQIMTDAPLPCTVRAMIPKVD